MVFGCLATRMKDSVVQVCEEKSAKRSRVDVVGLLDSVPIRRHSTW
jgi:hypothetical protein